jgi:uncharacterized protein
VIGFGAAAGSARYQTKGDDVAYFALFYEVVDNFVERRTPYRPEHLRLVHEAYARGDLLIAGALAEPAGALLVFRVPDRSVVEEFARDDPYVTGGLVGRWEVRPWAVVTDDLVAGGAQAGAGR